MASEFDTKGCEGIKCPECPQSLDYHEVQEAASAKTFEAYDKLAQGTLSVGSMSFRGVSRLGVALVSSILTTKISWIVQIVVISSV